MIHDLTDTWAVLSTAHNFALCWSKYKYWSVNTIRAIPTITLIGTHTDLTLFIAES